MIQYNPKNWFSHIFSFHKGDTLRKLWKELIIVALYGIGVAYFHYHYLAVHKYVFDTLILQSVFGFVLSLLLVFRTNSAYDRWWEGRKAWGALVNNCRNLSFKVNALDISTEEKNDIKSYISLYPYTLKEHLRGGRFNQELLNAFSTKQHLPNAIARKLYEQFSLLKRRHKITPEDYFIIDKNLNALTDVLGICERIKNTPIPFSYNIFLKKFVLIYIITLPFGFIPHFGYWSPLILMFVFYVFISLELIAEEIEDPFGKDYNDLPTDKLSETIENNVNEIIVDK